MQDVDPNQNSKLARQAFKKIFARNFDIQPRSPDLNPIENVFNFAKEELRSQALDRSITFEKFNEFSSRVKRTLCSILVEYIDKNIESMGKRIGMIIKVTGEEACCCWEIKDSK